MSELSLFDAASVALEGATFLDRLEARGTLRIAIRDGGFDAKTIAAHELRVVIGIVLVSLLVERGVENAVEVCETLIAALPTEPAPATQPDTPEAIFARLGGS